MKKRVVLTGGGSTGHVAVNLALIPRFLQKGWEVYYMGSKKGIEAELISKFPEVTYYPISTGKLRRYFTLKNIADAFRVKRGLWQSYRLLYRLKPNVIFSKGGYVAVPVVLGGWLRGIPVVLHESDLTPGLANRITLPFATKVCTTFTETVRYLKTGKQKVEYIGPVIRDELSQGDPAKGYDYCQFTREKPVMLVMGGSQGAQRINEAVRTNLDVLLKQFQIIHICGRGHRDPRIDRPGYRQFEYLNNELAHVLSITDLVVSRAGSNAIFEFLLMRLPMLLIPLSQKASRGDQIANANYFRKAGYCHVLMESELTEENFLKAVKEAYGQRQKMITNMEDGNIDGSCDRLYDLIKNVSQ